MSNSQLSKGRLLAGAAVLAVIAGGVVVGAHYYPAKPEHTAGTVAPMQRYQSNQIAGSDVVTGDTATADSYLFVLMEHEKAPVLRVFGRYHDDLVRCPDGRWRFRRREATIDSQLAGLAPFVDGMARFRDPVTGELSVPA